MVTLVGTVITVGTIMFKDNKYTKHYNLLIEKAKNRTLPKETYTEKHHIIPRSMGGSNKKENLAHLTAREHFICHWLLIKMTEESNRHKMLYALRNMRGSNDTQKRYYSGCSSRAYQYLRIELQKVASETVRIFKNGVGKQVHKTTLASWLSDGWQVGVRPEVRKARTGIPSPLRGRPQSEEARIKNSLSKKGKPISAASLAARKNRKYINDGVKEKMVKIDCLEGLLAKGWILGRLPISETHRMNLSASLKGKPSPLRGRQLQPKSEETKLKISLAKKGIPVKKEHRDLMIGRRWIYNNTFEKSVHEHELASWLSLGWVLGRKSKRF